ALALGDHRGSLARSVLDGDERADRGVGPDLGGGRELKFDASESLRSSERAAVEGVEGVAAVEVADVANAWIAVTGAVRIGSAHRADRDVLEHGESAQLGRGGGHAGVAGRAEDRVPVVPEGQRLRNAATHVDV